MTDSEHKQAILDAVNTLNKASRAAAEDGITVEFFASAVATVGYPSFDYIRFNVKRVTIL